MWIRIQIMGDLLDPDPGDKIHLKIAENSGAHMILNINSYWFISDFFYSFSKYYWEKSLKHKKHI